MDPRPPDRREQRALWGSAVAMVAIVFLQAPGRIVPETKLDITLDPVSYLGRALAAWDPSAGFGRVQNQAIGYLFPMGAFSAAARGIGVAPWLVQRSWIALVAAMGLWGAHRVAVAIGIGSPAGRLTAAWAYALAPATIALVGFQSAGQVPYALAPHVLVPLLRARPGDDPRRVAARSALWVAAMGGVNGASAFAVLPLVVIWFASRQPGEARRRLAAWWVLGAGLATLWWLIPLLVSVRYGIRFTDYTERSAVTTITESSLEVLRGTGNWLSYVQTDAGRWLPGAWALTADRIAVVGSVGVAACGAWGLARRDAPGRAWLVPAALAGAVAIGAGYAGPWGGGLAGPVQQLLDGPLVAFRNVHKFSAVLRLPLAMGTGHLVTVALAAARSRGVHGEPAGRRRTRAAAALAILAPLLVLAAAAPAADRLTAPGSFDDVPAAWRQADAWLQQHQGTHRTLLLPGSAFAEYGWGRPLDEPISALGGVTWAVRDLVPLGGNGSTRLLDGFDRAFETGTLPPGAVSALQRAGIGYLLVRNDLDLVRTGGPRPATVRRVLQTDARLELAASFGAVTSDPGRDDRVGPRPGSAGRQAYRELDVYRVPDPAGRLTAYPAAGALEVAGGQEAMLELDPDLVDQRATVLAVDLDPSLARRLPAAIGVATDTARRRDVAFGEIRDNVTYTLTQRQPSPATGDAPTDRWPGDGPSGLTVARLEGAAHLAEGGGPPSAPVPEDQPFAAFDGDPTTTWTASVGAPGEWLEVSFAHPVDPRHVAVSVPATSGLRVSSVRVTTDRGSRTARIGPSGVGRAQVPAGSTRRIRITITGVAGTVRTGPVGLNEVTIDGVALSRPLVMPAPRGGADVAVVGRDRQDPFSTHRRDEDGVLDRSFTWGGARSVALRGTATPVPGARLDAALAAAAPTPAPAAVRATASSRLRDQPGLGASATLDGDPRTAWVSAPEAGTPSLELSWPGAVPVDEVQVEPLATPTGAGLAPVDRVEVEVGGHRYVRSLDPTGRVTFPATSADRLTLRFPRSGGAAGARQVAIAEVEVPALIGRAAAVPDRSAPLTWPCGRGPWVSLDGSVVPTRASSTVGEVLDGTPVRWAACTPTSIGPGPHRLRARAGSLIVSQALIEPTAPLRAPGPARSVAIASWRTEHRVARLSAGPATIVATTENANAGWVAHLDGERLTPVRVDGWRQGWLVPAGGRGQLDLRYAPGAQQRRGLLLGALGLGAVAAAALIGPRRRAARWSPPGERAWHPVAVLAGLAITGFVLGGAVVVAAVGLAALASTRWHRALAVVAPMAVVAAGCWALAQPGADLGTSRGSFAPGAQFLAVVAILAVGASLLPSRQRHPGDQTDEAAG